jgi:LPXTG-motif cell wall-anchored protein
VVSCVVRNTGHRPGVPGSTQGANVQLTSSPRRALGLLAVSTVGLSTAVIGVTGVASAATTTFTFSTDPAASVDQKGISALELDADPADTCAVAWVIDGAAGGNGKDSGNPVPASPGGHYTVTTEARSGDVFELYPGAKGEDSPLGSTSTSGDGGASGFDPSAAGQDGQYNGSNYGGGGGAASVVAQDGSLLLAAFGGDGGLSGNHGGTEGVGGFAGEHQNFSGAKGTTGKPVNKGVGVISGTVTCAPPAPAAPEIEAPGTPTVNWIQGGEKSAQLQIWAGWVPEGATATPVYEYSLDGGPWKKLVASDDFQVQPTITGLVNDRTYSVRVRMTVDGVSSEPTEAQEVTPRHVVGAPTKAAVTTGPGSLTISWAPPADPTGVTGYEVWAIPGAEPQSNAGQVDCPTLDVAARSCTIGVPVGMEYSVGIRALDANGGGDAAWLVSDEVQAAAAPSALPKSSGALSTSGGAGSTVTSGATVTLTGGGYLPGSTVTLVMYSTPVVLGTTVADEKGNISAEVTLPAGVRGNHTLVASGIDPSGKPRNLTMAVTVTGEGELPYTGADVALPALGGLAALALGGGLLFAARRRSAA